MYTYIQLQSQLRLYNSQQLLRLYNSYCKANGLREAHILELNTNLDL